MGCPGGCWGGHQGDHWGGHVLEPSKEAQQAALHYPLAWNPWRRHPLAYGVEYPMQENPLLIILHS